ncbi:MAG: Sulfate permease 2 [Cirrosporium novae-zelandiae]|nr:MAG: Sulfate permease 2 [Cirrosporium novae-zelandiae]
MPSQTATRVGHGLAKFLGIKLDRGSPKAGVTRGESVFSIQTADEFIEPEPTAAEWIRETLPNKKELAGYVKGLFPFTHWITRYNVQWLIGDLVAGITVGAVVVPQSMAYAKLAELPVQYGLYSSFMGVILYWFFATSKDITIGPVAVLSKLTGDVILKVQADDPSVPGHVIASSLALISGAIVLFIGLIRCGWIVDFIPLPAISAFMTGSALNICVGQVPTMMGISGFSTRDATYKVVINILKHLGRSKIDAAMGLTALAMLYIIRSSCKFAAKKFPSQKKLLFFLSTLRTVFVILLYTLISWLVNRNRRDDPLFKILGSVPRGFQAAGAPKLNSHIIGLYASDLPVTVIVLLIEHIAISKSFGRINNYTINPSQEMVAIGFTNILGPFLGAYPATGSFSRTAIKSKAGVRTPFAGVITGVIVLLAIYALTAVFFYIPQPSLAGVIIHAVGDLITPPNTVYQFWRVSPLEVVIFFAGVFVTVFTTIENGIYTTICISVAVLLFRIVKAKGHFLGKVTIHSVIGDHLLDSKDEANGGDGKYGSFKRNQEIDTDQATRDVFLPIDHNDGSNPEINVESPYPGIFIYRFSEGYNYPNANHYLDKMVAHIFKNTRRTNANHYPQLGDRPWNDPGPRRGKPIVDDLHLPTLKAIILDFSSVNNVDITSIQHLIDVRNQLDLYVSPDRVEWHFASIHNRWTKRALAASGFGYPSVPSSEPEFRRWKPLFSVAEMGGSDSAAADAEARDNEKDLRSIPSKHDLETGTDPDSINSEASSKDTKGRPAVKITQKLVVVSSISRPLFHTDLTIALQSAVANAEGRGTTVVEVAGKQSTHEE